MTDLPADALVVLYDGVCGFCNGLVRFLLRRDRHRRMWFASLQSPFAAEVLARHGRTSTTQDTMYLVTSLGTSAEKLVWKSTAALALFAALPFPWRLLALLRVVPRPVRDVAYDALARVRYRLFGKYDACPLPRPEWRPRFLPPTPPPAASV
jgi:predicted DCC family thiol-disulfide oxidoreductase YuxK